MLTRDINTCDVALIVRIAVRYFELYVQCTLKSAIFVIYAVECVALNTSIKKISHTKIRHVGLYPISPLNR